MTKASSAIAPTRTRSAGSSTIGASHCARPATDPFGDEPSDDISWKKLDALLSEGDLEAAGVLHGAIEDFAQELALVIRRFLELKAWRGTERIVVGGGFRASRTGEIAIGRAAVILKADKIAVDLEPIRHDPDEAGLIGAAHLAPRVDVRGARCDPRRRHRRHQHPRRRGGPELEEGGGPVEGGGVEIQVWRHAEEKKIGREAAVKELVAMLRGLIKDADKEGLSLAPFIGVGCPGIIDADGTIDRGAQNLPGNWESSRFNLPLALQEAIPTIGEHETVIMLHNDAVVQGLSQAPFMTEVTHWGALTIGTGLGNARFSNRDTRRKD